MITKRIIPCLDVKDNKVVKGMQFKNHEIVGSIVDLAEKYSNDGADELVFYDISASNLLVECIVRNTPILIKRHPATIEYLGEGYPFYFDDLFEANLKATDMELIYRTHEYMKNEIDKHKFTVESFVSSFFTSKTYNLISKEK